MMVLCRKDSFGFFNELYYRCLACGFKPEDGKYMQSAKLARKKQQTLPKLRSHNYLWQGATVAVLAGLVIMATMQIPVPVTVFATQTSLDSVKAILPYIRLLNFTIAGFTFNYTEGQMTLDIAAANATVKSTESSQNVTTSIIYLHKVLVSYTGPKSKFTMGFTSLTVALTIRYEALLASINGTTVLPLWTDLINSLTGQMP